MRDAGIKLYFDGGCRPNPGAMEAVVVVRGIAYRAPDLGDGTSSDAEWLALIHAVMVATEIGATDIVLLGDSAMVVDQASGKSRPNRAFAHHLERYRSLAAGFARVRLRHIARTQNLAGIALDRARHGLG